MIPSMRAPHGSPVSYPGAFKRNTRKETWEGFMLTERARSQASPRSAEIFRPEYEANRLHSDQPSVKTFHTPCAFLSSCLLRFPFHHGPHARGYKTLGLVPGHQTKLYSGNFVFLDHRLFDSISRLCPGITVPIRGPPAEFIARAPAKSYVHISAFAT